MLVKVYFKIERLIRLGHAFGEAMIQAVVLGLLDAPDLERITVSRFEGSRYAEPSVIEAGLQWWERDAIQQFFPPEGRVVVGAAGAGREVLALHKRGYEVDGFECARTLVETGQEQLRRAGVAGRFEWAPP